MTPSIDVFAETNPAFCAFTLRAFSNSFKVDCGEDPSKLLCYLVLPIALSSDLSETFDGTNRTTGFLTWIDRNPSMLVNMERRIQTTLPITRDAIQFGCFAGILGISDEALISASDLYKKSKKAKQINVNKSNEANSAIKRADRLGSWIANVKSIRTTYSALGLSL